jgi:hypothetical protein
MHRITAAQAWVKLICEKVNYIGREPYVFVRSIEEDIAISCICGWDDSASWGDGEIDYGWDKDSKIRFIRFYNKLALNKSWMR